MDVATTARLRQVPIQLGARHAGGAGGVRRRPCLSSPVGLRPSILTVALRFQCDDGPRPMTREATVLLPMGAFQSEQSIYRLTVRARECLGQPFTLW